MVRWVTVFTLLSVVACGSKSPTAPSVSAVTKTIVLVGNLDYGAIQVGRSFSITLEIRNTGTTPLTVTGFSAPFASNFAVNWTGGTIAPGASQPVGIRFSPTAPQSYSGTLTVNGDQTSGANTTPINASGTLVGVPVFSRTGVGDTVFDTPTYLSRVRITGLYTGYSSNFVVKVNGRLIVNELLGTGWPSTRYDGTLLLPNGGGVASVEISSGVNWTFTEVR